MYARTDCVVGQKGTAHACARQNRDQRVLENSDRHYALTCTRHTRKRRRILYEATTTTVDDDAAGDDDNVIDAQDAKLCSARTIVFGGQVGWEHAG